MNDQATATGTGFFVTYNKTDLTLRPDRHMVNHVKVSANLVIIYFHPWIIRTTFNDGDNYVYNDFYYISVIRWRLVTEIALLSPVYGRRGSCHHLNGRWGFPHWLQRLLDFLAPFRGRWRRQFVRDQQPVRSFDNRYSCCLLSFLYFLSFRILLFLPPVGTVLLLPLGCSVVVLVVVVVLVSGATCNLDCG